MTDFKPIENIHACPRCELFCGRQAPVTDYRVNLVALPSRHVRNRCAICCGGRNDSHCWPKARTTDNKSPRPECAVTSEILVTGSSFLPRVVVNLPRATLPHIANRHNQTDLACMCFLNICRVKPSQSASDDAIIRLRSSVRVGRDDRRTDTRVPIIVGSYSRVLSASLLNMTNF